MEYKITVMKNAFYAQSGGVTSVINCSAYGLISKFKKDFSEANIYASKNGIVGLLEGELYYNILIYSIFLMINIKIMINIKT